MTPYCNGSEQQPDLWTPPRQWCLYNDVVLYSGVRVQYDVLVYVRVCACALQAGATIENCLESSAPILLKMGSYSSTTMSQYWTIANLLSSILTILLTCPNNDTVLCYSNDPLLTVYACCNWVLLLDMWFPRVLRVTATASSRYGRKRYLLHPPPSEHVDEVQLNTKTIKILDTDNNKHNLVCNISINSYESAYTQTPSTSIVYLVVEHAVSSH